MKNVGTLHGHLVYFTAIWSILWPFFIFCGYLVYFSHFGMLHQEKSGNYCLCSAGFFTRSAGKNFERMARPAF
jgi:hypothetical protein